MKQQLLKIASLKVGLITAGALIFVAGTTVAVNHRTVNIKSADSAQPSTSSTVDSGQADPSPSNDPTADPSTTSQPAVSTGGSTSSPTITNPTAGATSPAQVNTSTAQAPPPVTLVSQKIVNDAVNPTPVPVDPNHQSGTEWVETASCLSTYSDGSTSTKDLGIISQKNVAFSAKQEGRDCSNLSF